MNLGRVWSPELTTGLFVVAGAGIALLGVLVSQWWQGKRDRENDARALRDAKRARLEQAYMPTLLAGRAMWELVMRHGKKPEEVELTEEQVHLTGLWRRATSDVESHLVRLTLEADREATRANEFYNRMRSEFYAYLSYLKQESSNPNDDIEDDILKSREAVYSSLQELEILSRRHLNRLAQPLPLDRSTANTRRSEVRGHGRKRQPPPPSPS